jgi:hypothetical protein
VFWSGVTVFGVAMMVSLGVAAHGDPGYTVVGVLAMAPFVVLPARYLRVRVDLRDGGIVVCNYSATRHLAWSDIDRFFTWRAARGRVATAVRTKDGETNLLLALQGLQSRNVYTDEPEATTVVNDLNETLARPARRGGASHPAR